MRFSKNDLWDLEHCWLIYVVGGVNKDSKNIT